MMKELELPQIKRLTELLVECSLIDSVRKASAAIKSGEVYVASVRVANPTALLVLTAPTRIRYKEREITIGNKEAAGIGSEILE